jgi:undecaprenyl diphosphate synthase
MLVKQVAYRIYERTLGRNVAGGPVPKCVALVISDGDLVDRASLLTLLSFVEWCAELGTRAVSIYVSVVKGGGTDTESLARCIQGIFNSAGFPGSVVTSRSIVQLDGEKPCSVTISIGYGGKYELVNALKGIMEDVKEGRTAPAEIDEGTVEKHLIFKCEPDLFIRTGEARLTDFLIWQAVYSELYFTDINWEDFRKIDLLRAIRDYQYRQRRFGT